MEERMRVEQVLESLDELIAQNEHLEFYWFPFTPWTVVKRNNRTTEPPNRGRMAEFRDDILLQNVAFGAVCRLARLRPKLIPWLMNRVMATQGGLDYIDRSDKVFTTPRWVRFYEMEYAIPREATVEALRRLRSYVDSSGLPIVFPIEVRFLAGDDIPLSTASGRESCYIAVHVYQGMLYQQYFEAVEAIMEDYDGRPHWGKLHFQTAERLAPRYPQWERFLQARRRIDGDGRFSNAYLDRVLGRQPSAVNDQADVPR
jgi:L-gulonolactone oxidase